MAKRKVFKILGFAFSVFPPLIATLEFFPIIPVAGKVSVLAVIALIFACMPFIKTLKRLLASPSAWMMWGGLLAFCLLVRAIVDEFYTISILGFAGSVVGAGFFYLAKGGKENG